MQELLKKEEQTIQGFLDKKLAFIEIFDALSML